MKYKHYVKGTLMEKFIVMPFIRTWSTYNSVDDGNHFVFMEGDANTDTLNMLKDKYRPSLFHDGAIIDDDTSSFLIIEAKLERKLSLTIGNFPIRNQWYALQGFIPNDPMERSVIYEISPKNFAELVTSRNITSGVVEETGYTFSKLGPRFTIKPVHQR
jgi:hypothetical protein